MEPRADLVGGQPDQDQCPSKQNFDNFPLLYFLQKYGNTINFEIIRMCSVNLLGASSLHEKVILDPPPGHKN